MSGDHNMHQKPRSYLDDFECPRCGHCCKTDLARVGEVGVWGNALEKEPLYWSVTDGWVYADDTSENHVDETVKCKHEPVAWRSTSPYGKLSNKFACKPTEGNWVEPLYTAPQKRELTCVCGAVWEGETMVHPPRKREWVGLTDEERDNIKDNYHNMTWTLEMFGRAIEAKLREKNT